MQASYHRKKRYTTPRAGMHPRYILRAEHFTTPQGGRCVWCLYDTQNMRLEGQTGQTKALVPNRVYHAPGAKFDSLVKRLFHHAHINEAPHQAPPVILTATIGMALLAIAKTV